MSELITTYKNGEALRNALPALAVGTVLLYHRTKHIVIDTEDQGHRVRAFKKRTKERRIDPGRAEQVELRGCYERSPTERRGNDE